MRYFFLKSLASIALLLPMLQAFCGAPAFAAAEGSCNGYVPARIDVQVFFDPVDYQYYTPMLAIRKISNDGKENGQSEAWPVGLSTGQIYLKATTDILKMRSGYSQTACTQIKAMRVQFGFKDNKIYVAREFPRRSCPFRQVLEHEEKHKNVDRSILKDYQDRLRADFAAFAMEIGVLRGGGGGAERQIDAMLKDRLDKLSQELQSERRARQGQVDSEEEYQRIQDSCDGQLMEVVQQRLDLLEETYPGISKPEAGSQKSETGSQKPEKPDKTDQSDKQDPPAKNRN